MSTRATARSTSRRLVTGAIRSLILGVGIVGASVAVVLWLTDPLRVCASGCGRAPPGLAGSRPGRGTAAHGCGGPSGDPRFTPRTGPRTAARGWPSGSRCRSPTRSRSSRSGRRTRGEASGGSLNCGTSWPRSIVRTTGGRATGAPAPDLPRHAPHVDRRIRRGRSPVRRGAGGRSRLPQAAAGEHRGPPRGRGPAARRDRELRRLLQRVELHLPAGRPRRSTAALRARARRSATSPPTSSSGPRTWASGGS